MAVTTGLKLDYVFTPLPSPIYASAPGANANSISLQVMISNPALSALAIAAITITIPTGPTESGAISTATNLPPPTYDHSIHWSITTSGSVITITPRSQTGQPATTGLVVQPIILTLPGILVSETPGSVPITIAESMPSPTNPQTVTKVTDDHTYSLVKQPTNDWVTSFTVDPPQLTALDEIVTLSWTCSSVGTSLSYGLRMLSAGKGTLRSATTKATIPTDTPTLALNDCAGGGLCYTAADGLQGVKYGPVNQTTVFALDVVQPASSGGKTVLGTLETTVQLAVPAFASEIWATQSPSGRLVMLHWLAFNAAYCTVMCGDTVLVASAPTDTYDDGYRLVMDQPPGTYTLQVIAHPADGPATAPSPTVQVTVSAPAAITSIEAPMAIAITPDGTRALVTSCPSRESPGSVVVIDPVHQRESGPRIGVGLWPGSIAISPDGMRAFVGNQNDSTVTVLEIGETIAALPSPPHCPMPSDLAVTSDGTRVLVACSSDPKVRVVDASANPPTVLGQTYESGGAWAIAILPNGTFAVTADDYVGSVSLLDLTGKSRLFGWIKVGEAPHAVAVTSDNSLALVTNSSDNTVSVIEMTGRQDMTSIPTGQVVATIPTGRAPSDIAIAPDDSYALVSCLDEPNLTVITMGTWSTTTVPVGARTSAVAIAPDGTCWVVASAAGAQSYVTVL